MLRQCSFFLHARILGDVAKAFFVCLLLLIIMHTSGACMFMHSHMGTWTMDMIAIAILKRAERWVRVLERMMLVQSDVHLNIAQNANGERPNGGDMHVVSMKACWCNGKSQAMQMHM